MCVVGVGGRQCEGALLPPPPTPRDCPTAVQVMSKRVFWKQNLVELLRAEKSTMMRMKHPLVVSLRWAWQTGERAFLVMDYMPVWAVRRGQGQGQSFSEGGVYPTGLSALRGSRTQWATAGAPEAPLWKGMVGQAREGTSNGGTGHLGFTHTEMQRGRLWTA